MTLVPATKIRHTNEESKYTNPVLQFRILGFHRLQFIVPWTQEASMLFTIIERVMSSILRLNLDVHIRPVVLSHIGCPIGVFPESRSEGWR
jgi:hypothetical protein